MGRRWEAGCVAAAPMRVRSASGDSRCRAIGSSNGSATVASPAVRRTAAVAASPRLGVGGLPRRGAACLSERGQRRGRDHGVRAAYEHGTRDHNCPHLTRAPTRGPAPLQWVEHFMRHMRSPLQPQSPPFFGAEAWGSEAQPLHRHRLRPAGRRRLVAATPTARSAAMRHPLRHPLLLVEAADAATAAALADVSGAAEALADGAWVDRGGWHGGGDRHVAAAAGAGGPDRRASPR